MIKRIGSQFIAGFVAEPIIGAAGAAITPPPGYYERLSEVCRTHDVLFIADEVMTGLGRTGRMLATDIGTPYLILLYWGRDSVRGMRLLLLPSYLILLLKR